MDDLIAFVTARLDEDEAAAKAVDQEPQRPAIGDTEPRPVRWFSKRVWFAPEDGYPAPYVDKARTALADRFDPARVLREVEAGRALIARYACAQEFYGRPENSRYPAGELAGLYDAIRCRAAVWDGHPDYRPVWIL